MTSEPACAPLYVDNRRINVATWGDPGASAVMLIHGMRDHCRSWDSIASALSHRYRVIAPDLRGHGDSDWAGSDGYALPAYIADVADVAEALALKRYAIISHSLGGAIGLRVAAAFPDRVTAFAGIECIEMPIQRDEACEPKPYPSRVREWLERRRTTGSKAVRYYASIGDACERMQREQPRLAPEIIRHLAIHAVALDLGRGWRWKFDPRVRLRAPEDQRATDLDEVLDAIACPVLLSYSDDGWIPLPAKSRLGRLSNVTISHYADAGHWLHHQFTERFITETLAFLDANCRTAQHA